MKKNLLVVGVLLLGLSAHAQLTYVGNSALVTVSANTLVYNGGGMKVDGTGQFNNSGNVMIVGASTDKFETTGTSNFVLKSTSATAYGQLYITGLLQSGITGVVNKEYITTNNGSYQQIGIPFYQKLLNSLQFGKTFSNTRYSKNEILTWDNSRVMSRFTDVNGSTSDATAYYMLGAAAGSVDFTALHTLVGQPYAEEKVVSRTLSGGGDGINFGGGNARNLYNEKYNTYLQDQFDISTPYTGTFGKNLYQYSNPYLTNLDLSGIYLNDLPTDSDGNYIANLQGIRLDPGTVKTDASGTYSTSASTVTVASGVLTGDVNSLIIKPLQTFVIKLNSITPSSLNFDKLRRFSSIARTGTVYSVTSARNASSADTVKQLGVIALNANGEEMGRTYFVVYNNGVSGHTDDASTESQNSSNNVIGTFEENANEGGIDDNYSSKYWLYINEVNEQNFQGKPLSLGLYNSGIKSLKFEIRENEALITKGVHNLSTGTGFYIKGADGDLKEVSQDTAIPVSGDTYSLFYGKPNATLGTSSSVIKPSRTQVVYNPSIDNYVVRFDPDWKKADIQVYDMSGKLILSQKSVSTLSDFTINLTKETRAYIVTATSEKGLTATAKIVR